MLEVIDPETSESGLCIPVNNATQKERNSVKPNSVKVLVEGEKVIPAGLVSRDTLHGCEKVVPAAHSLYTSLVGNFKTSYPQNPSLASSQPDGLISTEQKTARFCREYSPTKSLSEGAASPSPCRIKE